MYADESPHHQPAPAPLAACPRCACPDLFIRKDFPQKLGLSIVVVAAVAFLALAADPRTFYLGVIVLLAAAALDAAMYLFVPRITVCYRCRTDFRNLPLNPDHETFDLATAEKYRSLPTAETADNKPPPQN